MELLLPWLPGLFLLLGLLFGSLANVIIYRLPLMMGIHENGDDAGVNLWWPPSHCP
ncbi:prepilin peptidase, partial [Enterobacter sp. PGRG2]